MLPRNFNDSVNLLWHVVLKVERGYVISVCM